ncbi:MAG: mannitol-1-phosphate 5-dehydrogenase [bacterium]|nr:mannitol-1-phosphate 5-dehydrogenase [bacterium]
MNALVFGAGNIGRGFLGSLLAKAGFSVTFVDIDEAKVSHINHIQEYPVYIVSDTGIQEEIVRGIRAISYSDTSTLTNAVVEADIIMTAVGKEPLARVAAGLMHGLVQRIEQRPHAEIHIVVIACENIQDNTAYLQALLSAQTPKRYRERIKDLISFPNCVVDRIVPNTLPKHARAHPLAVSVEEYFQLAIDGTALKAPIPKIPGMEISSNLNATLEQKLFTLNMAHAIVGYYGYFKGYHYIHEAIHDKEIHELLCGALQEVAAIITARHRHISSAAQQQYEEKIMQRFKNPHLQDEIIRVARQPKRKLGPHDRLIRPALLTWEQGRIPAFLASGITAALRYDYANDHQAQELVSEIREQGIERVLETVSGLAPDNELARLIKADFLFQSL